MKKNNNWEDTLSGEEIKYLLTSVSKLEDIPEKTDIRVRNMINTFDFSGQKRKWADVFTHILFFIKKIRFAYVFASVASVCVILFIGIIFLFNNDKGIRIKGGESGLYIYLKTEHGTSELNDLDNVQEGDTIQISYLSGKGNYGSIFSVDGSGVITFHYPLHKESVKKLKKQKEVFLDHSYQLDDAPEYEVFFFVTSTDYFKVEEILDKLLIINNINNYHVPHIKNIEIKTIRLIKRLN